MNPALRPFRHRNYRVFYIGNALSLVGTWMQNVAVSWLVYRLTGSAWMLGLATGAQQLPMLFLAPLAGVWTDRLDRRRVLIVTQTISTIPALALAILTFTETVHVWHVIGIAMLLGVVNALGNPTRQAFVLDILGDRRDLPSAIALNAAMFNLTRFIGPPLAGFVIAAVGEGWCFLGNAISFAAIVLAYLSIRVAPQVRPATTTSWAADFMAGARYAYGFAGTRRPLLLVAALSISTAAWQSLMPLRAGSSETLGLLLGAGGLGAMLGTVALAMRGGMRDIGRVLGMAAMVAGIAFTAFAFLGSAPLAASIVVMVLFGFALFAAIAGSNSALQVIADSDKRGRVISFYIMSMAGLGTVGHFVCGALAQRIGVDAVFGLCGAVAFCCGLAFTLNRREWDRVLEARLASGVTPPGRQ